jgi:hypothetical protein
VCVCRARRIRMHLMSAFCVWVGIRVIGSVGSRAPFDVGLEIGLGLGMRIGLGGDKGEVAYTRVALEEVEKWGCEGKGRRERVQPREGRAAE